MKSFKQYYLLQEGRKHKNIIVIDVQPEYAFYYDESGCSVCKDIIQFVNQNKGNVLMFVNAEETGVSSDFIIDIKEYWQDNGFERDWNDVEIIDKGFGYLRNWMDSGVSDAAIIKAIRHLYELRISDSRQVVEDFDEYASTEYWKEYLNEDVPECSINVNWISVKKLKEYENSYFVGGGRNECLKEVELIMNAFNIKMIKIDSLIY